MKALITDITGFAGSHLADYILESHPEVEVYGLVRWRSRMENIRHIQDRIHLREAELKDMVSLKKALAYGTVMASFAVESLGVDRLLKLTREEIDKRFERFRQFVSPF